MTITPFDAVMLLLVVTLTIRGAITGFVSEFFSKAAVILGALGAVVFYGKLSPYVTRLVGPDVFPDAVAFLVLFIAIYLLVKILQRLAGTAVQGETMTGLDRALGIFLGLAEGVVAVAIVVLVVHEQPWFGSERLLAGSLVDGLLAPVVSHGPAVISGFLKTVN